ncbi:MAG: CPBP family intramembrane metalloprotease [Acidobacteria bacterium]|nr:CPBP family intramembrane metalloprotease [Acidobacteriota bacterium]
MQDPVTASVPVVPTARTATPPTLAARVSALVEVVLASGFPTQVAIGLLLVGAGLDAHAPGGRLSMTYVVTLWLVDAVVLVGLIVALVRLRGERLSVLLFGTRSILREAGLGLALVPVVFGLVIGALVTVRLLWPGLHNVAINPFEDLIQSRSDAAILATVAVLSGGIKEELQRAFVLRRFEQHLGGARVGLVIFSVVFGAGHFIQGWDVGVVTTLLGLFWGILYLKRGSFTASAVSHSGFNVAQIVQFVVFGS